MSALLAFMRGLVREVLGLAAWVGAIFAGVWALPRVRPQFQEWLGTLALGRSGRASAWCSSSRLIVLMLISRWISALVRASPIGGLDRTLGLVFGLARGAALVILAYIVAGMVVPVERWPEPVLRGRSLGPAIMGAQWVVAAACRRISGPQRLCAAAWPRDHGGGAAAAPPRRAGRSAAAWRD